MAILLTLSLVTSSLVGTADAAGGDYFEPLATFDVMAGNGSAVAEIVAFAAGGNLLVYTDGDNQQIGLVDVARLDDPQGLGVIDMPGEPTSLATTGPLALVAVNTSESFVEPSGSLVVLNLRSRKVLTTIDLGGQPDSMAVSPDGKTAAVVIENERDEDLNDGLIPQLPGGGLAIVSLKGNPSTWTVTMADLSPVAASAFAGSDLEPEFVDINAENEAVVTFQENNHLAVVDLGSGSTISHFPAGEVSLTNVDTEEEDLINLDSDITKRREPDAVAWIDADTFATANEGDYEDANGEEGGSRGFTVFHQDGTVAYESAETFEHLLVAAGHYNEGRSENKGVEPESVEVGVYGKRTLLFVGSERSNAVGVYDVTSGTPVLQQLLPTGIGPEGLAANPKRKLFVASTEADEADDGIPTMINIYRLGAAGPSYPMISSAPDANGTPVPWVALSGLAPDPSDPDVVYAVSDSFLAEGFVYTIDVSSIPALIIDRTQITGATGSLDLEGIAVAPDGTWYLASEGRAGDRPNQIVVVDPQADGERRIENLDELIYDAVEFDTEQIDNKPPSGEPLSGEVPSVIGRANGFGGLDAYLEHVALVSDVDRWHGEEDRVTLMTLHAAKGLEFPYVFIVGAEQGIIPSSWAVQDGDPNALEEERRLFFVGMTRAESELHISLARLRGQRGELRPSVGSSFLMELPHDELDVVEYGDTGPYRVIAEYDVDDSDGTDCDGSEQARELNRSFAAGSLPPRPRQLDRSRVPSVRNSSSRADTLPSITTAAAMLGQRSGADGESDAPAEHDRDVPLGHGGSGLRAPSSRGKSDRRDVPQVSVGDTVVHPELGPGKVVRLRQGLRETATVQFALSGEQRSFVVSESLLRVVPRSE